jgi:transposase InsO family protein
MWKESSVMNQRIQMISEYESGDYEISELAQMYDVSRKTVYKWVERFEHGGWDGLKDRSRAPRHHPNATEVEIQRLVIGLKGRWPLWGAPKLRQKLLDQVGPERCPAESTISQILRRHGLSRRLRPRRGRAVPSQRPLAHCQQANEVWSADFKGWFRTGNGQKCQPLTISDGHTRYLLCCQSLAQATGHVSVKPLFVETFREYGLPKAMRTDNGPPFAGLGLGGLSPLAVWWVRLGIELERIEPGSPQQNGRHERMHRTLKEATAQPPAGSLAAQQERFDCFRREYNQERPHEALGQQTPASVYEASRREYPERLPQPRGYPESWDKRSVRHNGEIRWQGEQIYLSQALAGQEVGLESVGEGQWDVHFETLRLGLLDERKKRIIPCTHLRRCGCAAGPEINN